MDTTIVTPTPGVGDNTPLTPQEPVVQPQPTAELTPQMLERQEIYKKYYGEQTPPETPAAPVTPEASPVPPAPAPAGPDLTSLQNEVAELKALLQKQQTPAAPVQPPKVEAPPLTPEEKAWVKKLQSGDLGGYEEEFARVIEDRIANRIQNQAVEQAMEMRRLEDDIEKFVNTVRTDNPDLDTPEASHLISSAVERRIAEEVAGNRVTSRSQYAETYKRILAEEVQRARTFVESIRGAAAPQPTPNANVRKELLSGAGVQPTALPSPGAPGKPAQPPIPTVQDYFASRFAASNRGKLLA